jgi:hypothetical protein
MTSLREFAQSCLGITGGFSVARDFFGYRENVPGEISLRLQLSLLRNPHIHLDVILVGADNFTSLQRRKVDSAVFGARQIFEQIPLGIGRVSHHHLDTADADGLDQITKKEDGKKLTRRFRGAHDDAMDVFFVRNYDNDGAVGLCNIPGCNKNLYAFNGCVVSTGANLGIIRIRRTTAHELGHGLRLIHKDDDNNLMKPGGTGIDLTKRQKNRMLRDCFVQRSC